MYPQLTGNRFISIFARTTAFLTLVAALAAGQTGATTAQPGPSLFPAPPVAGGTADIVTGARPDQREDAIGIALAKRVEAFRAAGYSLPQIDNTGAYWQVTQEAAYRLIEKIEDDCLASVELKLYLDAHAFETGLLDAVMGIDQPALLTLRLIATWVLPEKFGVTGKLIDLWRGYQNRFSHMGTVANLLSSAEIFEDHMVRNVAGQKPVWTLHLYRQFQKERWGADETINQQRARLETSATHLERINRLHSDFETAVAAEIAARTNYLPAARKAYADRISFLAKDEAELGERTRRLRQLQSQDRYSRNALEQIVAVTRPGGPFYTQERTKAANTLELAIISEPAEELRHRAAMTKLAYDYERAVELQMVAIMRLEVERGVIERYLKPLSIGGCANIERPNLFVIPPIDDAKKAGTPNNGDGLAQPGETVRVPVLVRNDTERKQPAYGFTASTRHGPMTVLAAEPASGDALEPGHWNEHHVTIRLDPSIRGSSAPFNVALMVADRAYRNAALSLPLADLPRDPAGTTRRYENKRKARLYNRTFRADLELTIAANHPFRVVIEAVQGDSHLVLIEFEQEEDIVIDVAARTSNLQFESPENTAGGRRAPVIGQEYWDTPQGQVQGRTARVTIPRTEGASQRSFGHELSIDVVNRAENSVHKAAGGAQIYGILARRVSR